MCHLVQSEQVDTVHCTTSERGFILSFRHWLLREGSSSGGFPNVKEGERAMIGNGLHWWMPVPDHARGLMELIVMAQKRLTRRKGSAMARKPRRWLAKDWGSWYVPFGDGHLHLFGKRLFGISVWSYQKLGYSVHYWLGSTWYGDVEMIKKRKVGQKATEAKHLAAVESNVFEKLMPIVEHCAAIKYDDGSERKPGWVTLRTRGSAWEVEVKDPDTASRLVVIQQNLDDALALVVVLLESEDAPWESDPWLAKQNAAQKRKS